MATETQVATYSNDPTNVPIDGLRLRVGDTDCQDAFLTDEECRFFLDAEPNSVVSAAARAARAIAAKVAKKIDYKFGSVSKTASQLYEHFTDLADRLDRDVDLDGVGPIMLGTTVAEKVAADADTGAVQPDFKKGIMDNPRSGPAPQNEPDIGQDA
jgi:hypothetical protein